MDPTQGDRLHSSGHGEPAGVRNTGATGLLLTATQRSDERRRSETNTEKTQQRRQQRRRGVERRPRNRLSWSEGNRG